jgi:hypothetical protein
VLAVLAFVAAGCGEVTVSTSRTIAAEELESSLQEDIANTTGAQVDSVDCPGDDIESSDGTELECELTLTDGQSGQVQVTFTDSEGNYDYKIPAGEFK